MRNRFLSLAVFALVAGISSSACGNIVGYVNYDFVKQGFTAFTNPLDYENTITHNKNRLGDLIASPPDGSAVYQWNATTRAFELSSVFSSGLGWSDDLVLTPGKGAMFQNPSNLVFTNTFVGQVLNPDGTVATDENFGAHLPVPLTPDNMYMLGCATPTAFTAGDSYDRAFKYIVGRGPLDGEQFFRWNSASQQYSVTTFDAFLNDWDHGVPVLNVGEAGLFNVGPVVPEPAALSVLCLLGGLALIRRPSSHDKGSA